jgi:hypothetical protein
VLDPRNWQMFQPNGEGDAPVEPPPRPEEPPPREVTKPRETTKGSQARKLS